MMEQKEVQCGTCQAALPVTQANLEHAIKETKGIMVVTCEYCPIPTIINLGADYPNWIFEAGQVSVSQSIEVSGNNNTVANVQQTAVGAHGVKIGGSVSGNIVTGDNSVVHYVDDSVVTGLVETEDNFVGGDSVVIVTKNGESQESKDAKKRMAETFRKTQQRIRDWK